MFPHSTLQDTHPYRSMPASTQTKWMHMMSTEKKPLKATVEVVKNPLDVAETACTDDILNEADASPASSKLVPRVVYDGSYEREFEPAHQRSYKCALPPYHLEEHDLVLCGPNEKDTPDWPSPQLVSHETSPTSPVWCFGNAPVNVCREHVEPEVVYDGSYEREL